MTSPRRILVIGIGAGDPDYLTIQAVKALNLVDVFFFPDKGSEKAELKALRETICARFIERPGYRVVDFDVPERRPRDESYASSIDEWRQAVEDRYAELFAGELEPGQVGGLLVWGDPCLYDGTIRMLERLQQRVSFEFEVIPGITAPQALAARHRVPLNGIGEPVLITTGRRLAEDGANASNVVVMLDSGDALAGAEGELEILWGAYLGMPGERLAAGRLADVRQRIAELRAEGRAEHGWIMDTYLLRRPPA